MINMITETRLLLSLLDTLDPNLARVFLPYAVKNPRYMKSFYILAKAHKESSEKRYENKKNGLKVPPFLILSITSKCNLFCSGCYAKAAGTVKDKEETLSSEEWKNIIKQGNELGTFGYVIAGGEPFLYPGLLDICESFPDRLFIIVTNGTAVYDNEIKKLRNLSNIVILVSIEGGRILTNRRRGEGVYEKTISVLEKLNDIKMFSGISVTITKNNFEYWKNQSNIDVLINDGIRIAAFMELIPTCNKENDLMLNQDQSREFRKKVLEYRENKKIYIIHSPGDEEYFGGCVSAGRGFAHVTPKGDLTPCPVSNVATHNLTKYTLKEALDSPLFREIRDNEHILETEGMPCALFAHPEEVDEIVKKVKGYRA